MNERAAWGNFWRYILGIGVCAALGLYAFVRGQRVPLLGLVDLGFHEFGHLVTYVFPAVVTGAMGSIMQVLVPARWPRTSSGSASCACAVGLFKRSPDSEERMREPLAPADSMWR